ncbi:hypothetical protein BDDG_12816, partial [Blastomyces dermatitidis ATCC 18188]
SSCIDRFVSADDSELNIKSLIENLKNVIIKKLFISCVTESSMSLSTSSAAVSFSTASFQSSTSVSVSDSLTLTTSVSVISTLTTFALTTAFVTSSLCFKKILYRLNKLCFSVCTLLLFLLISRIINYIKIVKDIHVFRNRNVNIILFYTHRCET